MSYTYHQAAKIIGCFPATVRRVADGLGMRRYRGGSSPAHLSDDDVIRIWEAVEERRVRASDIPSEHRTTTKPSQRPLVEERSETSEETSIQLRDNVGEGREERSSKSAERLLSREGLREHSAPSAHFSRSPSGPQLEPAGPISVDESTTSDTELRARIDSLALRKLDVEIATRELELATMKRARAVLAKGTDA